MITHAILLLLVTHSALGQQGCGVVSQEFRDLFIVGGEDAPEGGWPWQLSLEYYNEDLAEWRHTCGATLLSDTYALTAAHCYIASREPYRIVAGQHDRSVTSGNEQIIDVETFTRHPNYIGFPPYPNDVAILQLAEPVDVSSAFVGTACLPPSNDTDYAGNDQCWISGWGLLQGGDTEVPDILQQANIDVLTLDRCRELLGATILATHICIYDEENNAMGACSGDSGGPINCAVDGIHDVAGVASWVVGTCLTAFPTAYGRVSSFLDWIESETGITREVQDLNFHN